MPCPDCGCDAATGTRAHALQAALRSDDIDAAIALGLLDANITCVDCAAHCRDALQAARDERLRALAARERFRARDVRLARRQYERAERRKPIAPEPGDDAMPARTSSLPPAAADALARAKAKAKAARPRDR